MHDDHSVDFLKEKYPLTPTRAQKKRAKRSSKFAVIGICLLAAAGLLFSYQISRTHLEGDTGSLSLFSSVRRLMTAGDRELTGEQDDRINFLLLGVGGAGHDGGQLSDTIVFASFRPSSKEIGMLSIPRDLIVSIPGYGYRKINHINAYGEMEQKGHGPEFAQEVIGDLLQQDIHYYVKVDFDGFEELIDAIGGVDVYVERNFSDYTYPTDNYLTKTISFKQGWTTMDGKTALEYSRSRHGNNGEGSDFARAKRQQNVLVAVKQKMLSPSILLNPSRLNKVIELFQKNVDTNLTFWEIIKLARYAPDIETNEVSHRVLDSSNESPLYSSSINGAYVLLPKRDDWSDVRNIAQNVFSQETMTAQTPSAPATTQTAASTRVKIQNGTSITGLASQASQLLVASGFNVVEVGNADTRGYERTIIYDLTDGKKSAELSALKDFLEADVSMTAGGWVVSDEVVPRELTLTPHDGAGGSDIDFLIILGENATNLVLAN